MLRDPAVNVGDAVNLGDAPLNVADLLNAISVKLPPFWLYNIETCFFRQSPSFTSRECLPARPSLIIAFSLSLKKLPSRSWIYSVALPQRILTVTSRTEDCCKCTPCKFMQDVNPFITFLSPGTCNFRP